MSRLRVVPIVEGHGEYHCVRKLIERVWGELLHGEYISVLRPIRQPKSKLTKKAELQNALQLALLNLANSANQDDPGLVLILIDADKDPPCLLGPQLLKDAAETHGHLAVSCVVANVEFETWFVAAAESLTTHIELAPGEIVPENPEAGRIGKTWIQEHFRGDHYSETIDQPRMTAIMDVGLCRSRSPSFDKLCRELAKYAQRPNS